MPTVNEEYFDASLRHQIGIRQYSAGVALRVSRLLEAADRDIVSKLRARLGEFIREPINFTSLEWNNLLADIRATRAVTLQYYKDMVRGELTELAPMEAQREGALITSAVPFDLRLNTVALTQLKAIVSSRPFHGRLLGQWFKKLVADDQNRLVQQIQLGMAQQETIDDIVRRVVGTRSAKYTDGVLSTTRREAQAIVRTAVNHVSNTAREYVWDANSDIISARVWVSTLDGRTTHICMARDGHMAPMGGRDDLPEGALVLVPSSARPPAHINCRSIMVAYIDGVGLLGKRPFVEDTRTPAKRRVDFVKMSKATGRPVQAIRDEWAARHVGQIPAKTRYQDFLFRQPAGFQDSVLGVTKGKLFRDGGLKVEEYVDRAGNVLNLRQLAATKPEAFTRAGLDPSDF